MLYAYDDFRTYCFNLFSFMCFLGKFGPKIWSCLNWLKFGTQVDYYMLILVLMVIFSKFLSFIFSLGKFGPEIWSSSNWLKCSAWVHCYMLITILMFIFSKFMAFIFFWPDLVPKSEVLQIDWNLVKGYITICYFKTFYHSYSFV